MKFTQSGMRRYLRNTGWLLSGHAFRLAVAPVVTVLMARYLGPGDFGRLNFAMAVTVLLGLLANLGLDARVKRELAENPSARDRILGTYLLLSSVTALATYAGMLLVVLAWGCDPETVATYLLLGGVFLLSPLRGVEVWFHSQVQARPAVQAASLGVGVSAIAKIVLILAGAGVPAFAAAILLETVATVAALLWSFRRQVGPLPRRVADRALALRLLKDSWPLMVSGIAVTVYMQVDQVMLGVMLDAAAVGEYAAAVRITSMGYFVPMVLATSLFPAIVRVRSESADRYRARVRQFFQLNALCAYVIMIPMALLASWLIPFLFGAAYTKAPLIFQIHIWSLVFVYLAVAWSQVLLAEERYLLYMVTPLAGALANVALNFLLIPSYGGAGAAAATLVAQALASVGLCLVHPALRATGLLLVKALFPFGLLRDMRSQFHPEAS